ncbi:14570_t:CDS:2 [Acaulospora colombiana]|uniref:14570_t:CDS:1 n=1 Tax=Acaulospora colombiana TaxID=27376 RepID=A0ACA9LHQ9_9GLOM|nr:14570_t:CDS:2 [Acaulospora colombiana]
MLADRFGSGRKLGVVMGTVLSANTLGFITGPLVGGVLYQYWGYTSPFVFCAALSFIGFLTVCTIVEPIYLKEWDRAISIRNEELSDSNENNESMNDSPSIFSLIKDHNVITICVIVTTAASVFSGIEPTLPIHLREKFNANASQIGLVYVSVVIPTFISPLVGYISYVIGQRNTIGIGMACMALASPLTALPEKLWLEIVPLLFFGITYSIIITPTLPLLGQKVAQKGGGAYGQVYALWNMAYSVGMFVGPVVAGMLLEYNGFLGAMLIFSLMSLCVTPLAFVPSAWFERSVSGEYCRVPLDNPMEN